MKRLAVLLLVMTLDLGHAVAGDGAVATFTYGRPTSPDALTIDVDSRWIAGEGYRPVRVTIRPLNRGRFARDRRVTLQLNRYHQWRDYPREVTERVIELPEGAKQVTETIYVPQNRIQNQMEILFWEGRRTLRNVLRQPFVPTATAETRRESIPSVLIVDPDAPRWTDRTSIDRFRGSPAKGNAEGLDDQLPRAIEFIRAIGNTNDGSVNPNWKQMASWVDIAEQVAHCDYVHPQDLPERWIGLSGVDIICLSWSDLKRIQQQAAERWEVIDAWLRNGGMLWVSGVGSLTGLKQSATHDNQRLAEVERLLNMPAANPLGSELSPWQLPHPKTYGNRLDVMSPQQVFVPEVGRWLVLSDQRFSAGGKPVVAAPFCLPSASIGHGCPVGRRRSANEQRHLALAMGVSDP